MPDPRIVPGEIAQAVVDSLRGVVGPTIELQVDRHGSTRRFRMVPWDKVDGILYEHLGLKVELVAYARSQYLRVSEVRPQGPASELGLTPGDRLEGMRIALRNGRTRTVRVDSRENLAQLVSMLPAKTPIELEIVRDLDGDGRYASDELLRGSLTVE